MLFSKGTIFYSHSSLGEKSRGTARFSYDLLACIMVLGLLLFVAWGTGQMVAPISKLEQSAISLDPHNLPGYALRTTLRLFIAVLFSLVFSLIYAALAAKTKRLGSILIPILDILQSVPVLGYISFTVTAFMALFPGSVLGVELAAIFALFTSQAWNITFSFYQSLRTIPKDIREAAFVLKLSGWQRFWRMEVPFAIPGLVWNMMISLSGGWFFIVASEAVTLGNQQFALPGIGSYIALAIAEKNLEAIAWVILTMVVVIILYDQLLFRPLIAWSDKFRYDLTGHQLAPRSWVVTLFKQTVVIKKILTPFGWLVGKWKDLRLFNTRYARPIFGDAPAAKTIVDYLWYGALLVIGGMAFYHIYFFLHDTVGWEEVKKVAGLASITMVRVLVLIVLASLLWVPVGVYIGLHPGLARYIQPLAQLLAAFPANLLFPLAVIAITRYSLNPAIWLSPLMILGTQWYILFNVIAGSSAFPHDLRDIATNLKVRGWLWWKKVMLPGIFPYFLTGAITASGGAWNASIVSEIVSWGDVRLNAGGLGAYIAEETVSGNLSHVALGVGAMVLFVVMFNRLFWHRLYEMAAKKLRFD